MTSGDDFDLAELRRAVAQATPRPDPALRAAHLHLAAARFEVQRHATPTLAGRLAALRRFGAGGLAGAATAATALAACLLVLLPSQPLRDRAPSANGDAASELPAPPRDAPQAAEPAAEAQLRSGETAPPVPPATARTQPDADASAGTFAAEATRDAAPAPEAAAAPDMLSLEAAPELADDAAPEAAAAAVAPEGLPGDAAPEAPPGGAARQAEAAPGAAWAALDAALATAALPPAGTVDVAALVAALADPAPRVTQAPWRPDALLVRTDGVEVAWSAGVAEARPLVPPDAAIGLYEVAAPGLAPGESLGALAGGGGPLLLPRDATPDFAAAIVGFALLLQGTDLGGWSLDDAVVLAEATRGADPTGARAEALAIMRRTASLAR